MQTLEQLRANDAWEKSQRCSDEYVKLAKGLPALIMNSGLMQVLAFLEEKEQKGHKHCGDLSRHLRDWLQQRFSRSIPKADFAPFMKALMQLDDPRTYQAITAEAFAWLRWMRQMAPAAHSGGK
jgi:CRISPR-associated protein Cmr5